MGKIGGKAGIARERRMGEQLAANLGVFERWAASLFVLLVVVALAFGLGIGGGANKVVVSWTVLCSVLLSGTLVGAVVGFVFAIPRLLTRDDTGSDVVPQTDGGDGDGGRVRLRTTRRPLAGNSNLEEVSDWLTKILVGLGLVNARAAVTTVHDLATYVATAGLDGATGAGVVAGTLGIAGMLWGFLFFYLQTRTRITLMLFAAEEFQTAGGIPEDSVAAANEAPIAGDLERADVSDALSARVGHAASKVDPIPADGKLLGFGFDDLSTHQEFAAWGSAQARAGNLEAGETALRRANVLAAGDPIVLRRLAEVRALKGDLRGAVDNLREAADKQPGAWRIRRRELFHSLYLPPPDGFARAIPIADALVEHFDGRSDPLVHLWRACAYGQLHRWLARGSGSQDDLRDAREKALASVRRVVALAPDPEDRARVLLQRLLKPASDQGVAGDDDLADFVDDPDFLKAAQSR